MPEFNSFDGEFLIKIVHVITDLDRGGAEAMLSKVVLGMDRSRFENQVVSLTDLGSLGRSLQEQGILVHSLGMKLGRVRFLALPKLIRVLRRAKPAIVQSWLYHADLLALLSLPFSGFPALVWNIRCSNMDMSRYSYLTHLVRRCLVWCSGVPYAVVVNSEAGKLLHQELGYEVQRWVSISNGFDLEKYSPNPYERTSFRADLNIPEEAVLVGLIARVDPMKDHGTFFKAAQMVLEKTSQVYFLCAGTGTELLGSLVREYQLGEKMILLGVREQVGPIFSSLDICCLTSAFGEGFPNVLGEAMACEVPCVATDVGDSALIVGDSGKIVPVQNPSAMAQGILDLIALGPQGRRSLGQRARKKIAQEFSLQKIIESYEQFYASI